MSITLRWKIDGELAGSIDKVTGQVPIMVKVCVHKGEGLIGFSTNI